MDGSIESIISIKLRGIKDFVEYYLKSIAQRQALFELSKNTKEEVYEARR